MSTPEDSPERQQQLALVHALLQRGQVAEAEAQLLQVLDRYGNDRAAMEGLTGLYLQGARPGLASDMLARLVASFPDEPDYWLQHSALLERLGKQQECMDCYRALINQLPKLAVARFNFACFLKRTGHLEEALQQHQQAVDLGISEPEEVLSNMAVIHTELRQDEQARDLLQRALVLRPGYIPALYNLALWHEEFGDMAAALALFNQILEQDPGYTNALVRAVHVQKITDPDAGIVRKLRRALRRSRLDALAREGLHFALGKALDDCQQFDEAFAQYQQGNLHSAARLRPYRQDDQHQRTDRIIGSCLADRLAQVPAVSDRPLIFISGMFRSGSTLFERVLSAHPKIVAGGEIDYFNSRLARATPAFPESLAGADPASLRKLGEGYLEFLDRTFPAGLLVTDKHPDAFAYWGLLKGLFPNARFINTVRDPLDTCLSIFFQQLDDQVSYANSLENTAHYYREYLRQMQHWKQAFGASIHDARYDDYVTDPPAVTRALLEFLDLEWHEDCLNSQAVSSRVRTASVWQVRQPVHQKSSGRWKNYATHLESIRQQFTPLPGGH